MSRYLLLLVILGATSSFQPRFSHLLPLNIRRGDCVANQVAMNENKAGEHPLNEDPRRHGYTLRERNPFDVHVYYDNTERREKAIALREKMTARFPWMRFYSLKDRPIGPHPVPMWEADFGQYENRHKWAEVREFIDAYHGNLSVLIHPHSVDGDYADHTRNACWIGKPLELRIQGWR